MVRKFKRQLAQCGRYTSLPSGSVHHQPASQAPQRYGAQGVQIAGALTEKNSRRRDHPHRAAPQVRRKYLPQQIVVRHANEGGGLPRVAQRRLSYY
jgi:hypothetical protein